MTRHLLKPREAAERLRLSEGQVRALIAEGRLASVRVGKRSYVPSDAPEQFLSRETPCPDETAALGSNGSRTEAAGRTTSFGPKVDAAASAALALRSAERLKSPLLHSLEQTPARVLRIRQRSS